MYFRIVLPVTVSTYRAASRPICESLATGRYRAFSLVSSDSWLYRAIMVEISIVTAWYRSVMVDFDRRRPLLGSINLTAIGCGEGRSKRKRENLGWCHPLTSRQRLGCRRCLRLENLGMARQMRTSQGNDFFAAVFFSGSLGNFLSVRGEENETPARGEENEVIHRRPWVARAKSPPTQPAGDYRPRPGRETEAATYQTNFGDLLLVYPCQYRCSM
ncbi:hypothetical protein GW17_00017532 [Ensete ventricosum]|nr:hypothetical protein GW17_00017532 [Ensete ventricosum]